MKSTGVITKVVIWVLIILALGLLIYGLAVLGSKDGSTTKTTTTTSGIQSTDHVRGETNAPVVLVEYGDFQCPACGTAYPLVKQLETELGSKLAVVFRQFPLSQHKNARAAAEASEAAAKQGKFFEMHDMLYENQDKWSESSDFQTILDSYATQIGLDVAKFDADMKSSDVQSKIDDDLASGRKAVVNSTPTFFLNGNKMTINTYEQFMNDVRNAAQNTSTTTTNTTNSSNQFHAGHKRPLSGGLFRFLTTHEQRHRILAASCDTGKWILMQALTPFLGDHLQTTRLGLPNPTTRKTFTCSYVMPSLREVTGKTEGGVMGPTLKCGCLHGTIPEFVASEASEQGDK